MKSLAIVPSAIFLSLLIATDDPPGKQQRPESEMVVLRGKVLRLGPYLKAARDIPMDEDLGEAVLALVTDSGQVHPLIKDVRSRGFFMDKRLRNRPMQLHVFRYAGLPFVRVINVYSFQGGKMYKVDYWCTVCSITTFQPGPCPCCQDEIELRQRPVDEITRGN